MKKFFGILEDILFIAVITFLCLLLYSIKVNHTVSILNYRFYRIISNSMSPTLNPDDCIISKEVKSEEELKVGDIITFISHEENIYGQYNTHRIYDIVENPVSGKREYITKGDYFSSPDSSRVRIEDIKGKYIRRIPFSKVISFLVIRLTNNWVYFFVIMVPLIYCLLTYIYRLIYILVIGENTGNEQTKSLFGTIKNVVKNK